MDQRTAQGDALLHAPREDTGVIVAELPETHHSNKSFACCRCALRSYFNIEIGKKTLSSTRHHLSNTGL